MRNFEHKNGHKGQICSGKFDSSMIYFRAKFGACATKHCYVCNCTIIKYCGEPTPSSSLLYSTTVLYDSKSVQAIIWLVENHKAINKLHFNGTTINPKWYLLYSKVIYAIVIPWLQDVNPRWYIDKALLLYFVLRPLFECYVYIP